MPDLLERLKSALADRYAVESEIGRGGMATVFLAEDLKHHRQVAIKVLHPELAAAVGTDRFLREIEIVAGLNHPHILPLHDSGEAEGLLYYVMPYAEGESLRRRLDREKQLAVDKSVRFVVEVADGLDYAHRKGVVHRDIKPGNILLSEGHVVIADFGIARAIEVARGDRVTSTGLGVGTPRYASPEQAAAQEPVDGRTDIYSLGCVLYEMLAGEPPLTGATPQMIQARRMSETPTALHTVRDTVPPVLDHVIARALARVPADRYATASEFGQALQAILNAPAPATTKAHTTVQHTPSADRFIAVLPFSYPPANPEDELLADGITEDLIHTLSHVHGLRVVARTSAFAFKNSPGDVRTIGKQLNVDAVLEGSLRKHGDRIRVTASLVDARDGFELWSQRLDRDVSDIFSLQDDITQNIAAKLEASLALGTQKLHSTPSAVFPAYEHYLRGRHFWNQRTETAIRRSLDCYNDALALDPEFALALAAAAESQVTLGLYGLEEPRAAMPRATEFARRALTVNPAAGEPYASLGCARAVHDWDWHNAEADFKRALDVNPNYATAHQWYAINCLAPRGRFSEAHEHLRLVAELDPLSLTVGASVGLLYYLERDFERADSQLRDVLELNPGFPVGHLFLGQSLCAQDRFEDAVEAFQRVVETTECSPEALAGLAYGYAVAGMHRESGEAFDQLLECGSRRYVSRALVAQFHAGRGEVEQALAELETAVHDRATELIWLGVRPIWDPLRASPAFDGLLSRIHLQHLSA